MTKWKSRLLRIYKDQKSTLEHFKLKNLAQHEDNSMLRWLFSKENKSIDK